MTPDERLRLEERALAKREGDAAGWSRLSREYERLGRRDDAARAALRAHRAHVRDPELLARVEALGAIEGPWPCERGDAQNRQVSPLEGPDEGVLRWRVDLPRISVGRALVDLRGRVVVCGAPTGLFRVDGDGRQVEDLGAWRADLPPALVSGEPTAYGLVYARVIRAGAALLDLPAPPDGTIANAGGDRLFAWGTSLAAFGLKEGFRWRVGPRRGVVHDLAVAGESLFALVGTGPRHRLLALDARSGETRWETSDHTLPALEPFRVHVAAPDDGSCLLTRGASILCLGPGGERSWERKLEGPVGAPATAGDRVLVTTGSAVVELALGTGAVRWRRELRAGDGPTLDGRGIAYVSTYDGRVLGLRHDGSTHCQAIVRGTGAPSAVSIGWDRTAFVTVGRELVAIR